MDPDVEIVADLTRCPICSKVFWVKSKLKKHIQSHNNKNQNYKCPDLDCSASYETEDELFKHLKTIHPENKLSPKKELTIEPTKEEELTVKPTTATYSRKSSSFISAVDGVTKSPSRLISDFSNVITYSTLDSENAKKLTDHKRPNANPLLMPSKKLCKDLVVSKIAGMKLPSPISVETKKIPVSKIPAQTISSSKIPKVLSSPVKHVSKVQKSNSQVYDITSPKGKNKPCPLSKKKNSLRSVSISPTSQSPPSNMSPVKSSKSTVLIAQPQRNESTKSSRKIIVMPVGSKEDISKLSKLTSSPLSAKTTVPMELKGKSELTITKVDETIASRRTSQRSSSRTKRVASDSDSKSPSNLKSPKTPSRKSPVKGMNSPKLLVSPKLEVVSPPSKPSSTKKVDSPVASKVQLNQLQTKLSSVLSDGKNSASEVTTDLPRLRSTRKASSVAPKSPNADKRSRNTARSSEPEVIGKSALDLKLPSIQIKKVPDNIAKNGTVNVKDLALMSAITVSPRKNFIQVVQSKQNTISPVLKRGEKPAVTSTPVEKKPIILKLPAEFANRIKSIIIPASTVSGKVTTLSLPQTLHTKATEKASKTNTIVISKPLQSPAVNQPSTSEVSNKIQQLQSPLKPVRVVAQRGRPKRSQKKQVKIEERDPSLYEQELLDYLYEPTQPIKYGVSEMQRDQMEKKIAKETLIEKEKILKKMLLKYEEKELRKKQKLIRKKIARYIEKNKDMFPKPLKEKLLNLHSISFNERVQTVYDMPLSKKFLRYLGMSTPQGLADSLECNPTLNAASSTQKPRRQYENFIPSLSQYFRPMNSQITQESNKQSYLGVKRSASASLRGSPKKRLLKPGSGRRQQRILKSFQNKSGGDDPFTLAPSTDDPQTLPCICGMAGCDGLHLGDLAFQRSPI